jgi:class 3 adenylate cyclase
MELAKELNDPDQINLFRGLEANIYMARSDHSRALEIYLDLLKDAEAKKKNKQIQVYSANIGGIYIRQNKPKLAIPYLERSAEICKTMFDPSASAKTLITLGTAYTLTKQYAQAELTLKEAIKVGEQVNSPALLAPAIQGMVQVYQAKGELDLALRELEKTEQLFKSVGDQCQVGMAMGQRSDFLFQLDADTNKLILQRLFKGNHDQALKSALLVADSATVILEKCGDIYNLSLTLNVRSKIQARLGNYKSAFDDHVRFKTLNDTLFNQERDKQITENSMKYEFEKKEAATLAEQEKKDQRQILIRNGIITGLLITLFFLLIVWRQRNRISHEKQRSEDLLLNILPEQTAEELKLTGSAQARQFDLVTVLFTDFKGFTALSEQVTPKDLVNDLHECFSAFDLICEKYGIEKIKTIGDAYMAAGGLPTPNSTHAKDVVLAAIEMAQFIEEGKAQKIDAGLPFFEIRIGVHSGPVIAGIVGVKKFQYDIWGDTVNTASRMESSGAVGKVNISEATYSLVKDKFTCTYRGQVEAKGKGNLGMWFVEAIHN